MSAHGVGPLLLLTAARLVDGCHSRFLLGRGRTRPLRLLTSPYLPPIQRPLYSRLCRPRLRPCDSGSRAWGLRARARVVLNSASCRALRVSQLWLRLQRPPPRTPLSGCANLRRSSDCATSGRRPSSIRGCPTCSASCSSDLTDWRRTTKLPCRTERGSGAAASASCRSCLASILV